MKAIRNGSLMYMDNARAGLNKALSQELLLETSTGELRCLLRERKERFYMYGSMHQLVISPIPSSICLIPGKTIGRKKTRSWFTLLVRII